MIPKIIHYCWFGKSQKSEEILLCIESWKKHCPDFEIREWNEENFNVNESLFSRKMYKEKKWAFVADYARLYILEKYGGFYLDTDMLLVAPLLPLVENSCVLGEEQVGIISAGMIGTEPHHLFIQTCKSFYDDNQNKLITIPRALTYIYENYPNKESIRVLSPKTFYPYDSEHIQEFHGQDLGQEVIGVHLWHYSWGSPLNKFFKKIKIHSFGKKIAEKLGIKEFLKKLLGLI